MSFEDEHGIGRSKKKRPSHDKAIENALKKETKSVTKIMRGKK